MHPSLELSSESSIYWKSACVLEWFESKIEDNFLFFSFYDNGKSKPTTLPIQRIIYLWRIVLRSVLFMGYLESIRTTKTTTTMSMIAMSVDESQNIVAQVLNLIKNGSYVRLESVLYLT